MIVLEKLKNETQKEIDPHGAGFEEIDLRLRKALRLRVISGLDALRAIAVGLVLIDHFLLTDHVFGAHLKQVLSGS